MGIFSREITALYAAYSSGKENPLTPLEIQYADYSHWQRHTLAEEGLGEQLSYWQGQLLDAPELLTLPWDRARPAQQDYRGGRVDIQLGAELTEQLNALAQVERNDVVHGVVVSVGDAAVKIEWSGNSSCRYTGSEQTACRA